MSEQSKPRHVHKNIPVQVIGNHPHAGDFGYLVGETEGTVTELYGMVEIQFTNGMCSHGTRGCFAKRANIRYVKGKENPPR